MLAAGPEIANCQFSVFVPLSSQQCLTQITTPSMRHAITQLLGFHTLSTPPPNGCCFSVSSLDPSSFSFSRQWYILSCHPTDRISPKEKSPKSRKKSHWGHAHCHSYNNKQFGRHLDVRHWWNGAELCGDIHFVEYCAVNKIENYAVCLGT